MRLLVVASALYIVALPAAAFTKAEIRGLETMSGTTRLIQACNLQGLITIAGDKNGLKPEHVVIEALSTPQIDGDRVKGDGGVLRSGGKWYHLSYTCTAPDDHLKVTGFKYKVGEVIPKDQWAELNLYP